MAKIGVIGAGSWGTALTWRLAQNGHEVKVWSIAEDEVRMLNEDHEQKVKLPGVILPDTVEATTDLHEAMSDKDAVVLAVPSPFTRSTAQRMAPYCRFGQLIISVAKGIEEDSLMTLSEIIRQEIPQAEVAVLCGPTHAEEVGKGLPTAIVAGARTRTAAEYVQTLFMDKSLRVYTSPDMRGMELGAALKNVVALAAGVADGLGYGDNTKALLITRGIAEISRIGIAAGGRAETFSGLTGIGDLIVTCASMHSRNRRAGILIGEGKGVSEAMQEVGAVVEGYYATKAVKLLGDRCGVEMPITNAAYDVLYGGAPVGEVLHHLMGRKKGKEIEDAGWS